MSLFGELKRRGVVRVVVAYLAAAWLLLQIADLALPAYGFSEQSMAMLLNIVATGVVPVAILAWIFEWTSDGIARDTGAVVPATRAKTWDQAIIVVLLLATSYFVVDKFMLRPAVMIDQDRSIAVLPFVNMSSDPEQDYFSDGIAEELLNLLAKVRELRVISRSSSFAYRGQDINIAEVGVALNVAYVLEGSVRKAGDRIRITAQLIEAQTDKHLWSETYDRDLTDIFAIQDDVSAQIIEQLKVELVGEAPRTFRTDPETFAMFLRAKQQVLKSGLIGDPEAVRLMDEVVARDPDYVPGLLYLGKVIYYERNNHPDSPYAGEAGDQRLLEIQERVLELDPDNAQMKVIVAWDTYHESHDISAAAHLFEEALASGSGNIEVLQMTAAFAGYIGHFEEAATLAARAIARDPACTQCYGHYSGALLKLGRIDEAEAIARQRHALAPGGEIGLGNILMAKGEYESALKVIGQVQWEEDRLAMEVLAIHGLGDMDRFDRARDEFFSKYGETRQWPAAIILATAGEADAAAALLDVVFRDSVDFFGFALWDPTFEGLHGDPRWEALRERAGLTEEKLAAVNFDIPDGI